MEKILTNDDIKVYKSVYSDSLLWYAQQKFGCVAGTHYRIQLTLVSSMGAWIGIVAFDSVAQAGSFNPNSTTIVKCGGTIDVYSITNWGTFTHDGGFVCAMIQMVDPM